MFCVCVVEKGWGMSMFCVCVEVGDVYASLGPGRLIQTETVHPCVGSQTSAVAQW